VFVCVCILFGVVGRYVCVYFYLGRGEDVCVKMSVFFFGLW